jgi:hypothetical protein
MLLLQPEQMADTLALLSQFLQLLLRKRRK